MRKLNSGFVDSASIHGALIGLKRGCGWTWDEWTQQSALEATYLLLHTNIGMIPGPGRYRGAAGEFERLVDGLPGLESRGFETTGANTKVRSWLARYPDHVDQAWRQLNDDPNYESWAGMNRELFWIAHVQMHGDLFNKEHIPSIAQLTGASESDLLVVHQLSANLSEVRRWQKKPSSEAAKLAEQAYRISVLIRGKFHEFLARDYSLHLISHPSRKYVQTRLPPAQEVPLSNSEQYFVKILLGIAACERTDNRRVKKWVEAIVASRKAIEAGTVWLPNTPTIVQAETAATEAAKKIGLTTTTELTRSALDAGLGLAAGTLMSVALAPWAGPIVPVAIWAYKYSYGRGPGDSLARKALDTKRRFAKLSEAIPGRVERNLGWVHDR